MQDDKDIKLTIAPTPAEESVVQENLASATVEEKIDKDLTDNAQETTNMHDPTAKTLEDIMHQEAHESETQPPSSITLFLIIYITCRYQCQQKMVEIDRMEQQLTAIRYKATVVTSFLTEKSRESNIMDMLEQQGDSTLQIPKDPPYKINVPE